MFLISIFFNIKKNINISKLQLFQNSKTIFGLKSKTQDLKTTKEKTLVNLEKFMSLKKNNLYSQFFTRYYAIQSFLKLQLWKPKQNCIKCA